MIKLIISDIARTCLFFKHPENTWSGSINDHYDECMLKNPNFDFFAEYKLDYEYLDGLKNFKLPTIAFTSGKIQHNPQLKSELAKYFQEVLSPKEIGFAKNESEAYKIICEKFEIDPSQVVFIDDNTEFADAAKEAGINIVIRTSTTETLNLLNSLIKN